MELLDISITRTKVAELKAKGRRPKIDRAARSSAMSNVRDEIAATLAIYDDEEERLTLPDGAVMPHHANGNVAADNVADGNETGSNARTIEPFHRLCTSGRLHKSKAMNQQLYYVGLRYKQNYYDAGGTSVSQPPAYEKPVLYDRYDEIHGLPPVLVDKCKPYDEAAKVLDALEIREVIEGIIVHGRLIVGVGKVYSGRNQEQQARTAAITALSIGLIALRNHYGELKMKMAA